MSGSRAKQSRPQVKSTGVHVEISGKDARKPLPEPVTGEHQWIVLGVWRVSDPAAAYRPDGQVLLDRENLLSIEGPGCMACEARYSAEVAAAPCPGDYST